MSENKYEFWSKELEDLTCKHNKLKTREEVRKILMEQVNTLKNEFDTNKVFLSVNRKDNTINFEVEV